MRAAVSTAITSADRSRHRGNPGCARRPGRAWPARGRRAARRGGPPRAGKNGHQPRHGPAVAREDDGLAVFGAVHEAGQPGLALVSGMSMPVISDHHMVRKQAVPACRYPFRPKRTVSGRNGAGLDRREPGPGGGGRTTPRGTNRSWRVRRELTHLAQLFQYFAENDAGWIRRRGDAPCPAGHLIRLDRAAPDSANSPLPYCPWFPSVQTDRRTRGWRSAFVT